jgi:hypothetical protein
MSLCPARVATHVAVETSVEKRHNLALLSEEPDAKKGAAE